MKKFFLFVAFLISVSYSADWASIYHSLIAFDERPEIADANRPGYVKPLATSLGTVLNSNWITSASIPKNFSFEAGMPFALIFLSDDDREYANGVPTIFGDKKYEWGVTSPEISCSATPNCHVVNGNKNLHNLGVFTYPYLQLGGSFYHARLLFRGMLLPAISELRSFNLFGFGLQYSFAHLFKEELPQILQSFDISLGFGMNFSGISYRPENYKGSLDLDITTMSFMMVLGYKPIKALELMLTISYETSTMESGGHLKSEAEGSYGSEIFPTLSVDGDNGFRIGLSVAFSLGTSYHPVLGFDFGSKNAFTTNVLYFKQTFGKEEASVKKEPIKKNKVTINEEKTSETSESNILTEDEK